MIFGNFNNRIDSLGLPRIKASTKSKILHVLINLARPLTQSKLCKDVGVSTQSFRNHRDELQAFDLIRETEAGWIVSLPYRNRDVDDDGLPYYAMVDETPHREHKQSFGLREESLQGALYEALIALEDSRVLRDTTHPVTQPIYGRLSEDDLPTLLNHRPSWSGLVEFVVALREADPLGIGAERTPAERIAIQSTLSTATIGRPPDQAGLRGFEAEQTAPQPSG